MQAEREFVHETALAFPTALVDRPRVTVGTLVGRTFSVWKANLLRFAGVTLAIHLPSLLLSWAVGMPLSSYGGPFARPSPETVEFVFGPGWWVSYVAGLVLSLLHIGALTHGALQHLAGRRASVGEMLSRGLRRIWPILVAGALAFLAFYGGLLLLLVPGILFALWFSLAVPVVMAEPVGPVKALGRSRALTRGYRWVLLGTFLVTFMAVTSLGLVLMAVSAAAPVVGLPLNVALNALFGSILFVAPAVAYHDVRAAKEGADASTLARVFE